MSAPGDDKAGTTSTPSPEGSITGIVTNGSKQPLSGATIVLKQTKETRHTDATGKFDFSSLQEAQYSIHCTCQHYQEKTVEVLVARGKSTSVEIQLEPRTYSISGKIVDEKGNGVSGVSIEISGQEKKQKSDRDGKYALDQLQPLVAIEIVARKRAFEFKPEKIAKNVTSDIRDQNFIARRCLYDISGTIREEEGNLVKT